MNSYEKYIKELREQWIGKKIKFGNRACEVVGVSSDGFLTIKTPTLTNRKKKTFILPEHAQVVEEVQQ